MGEAPKLAQTKLWELEEGSAGIKDGQAKGDMPCRGTKAGKGSAGE